MSKIKPEAGVLKESLQSFQTAEAKITPQQAKKQVMIEGAINLKLLCDYVVSCAYGDIVLIISMLHDYISLLDEVMGDDVQYQAYYRKRFLHIADHLAEQIEYDYDAAIEKCRKNREKEDSRNIGGDAMELSVTGAR